MEQITILIADDHLLVREAWSFILKNDARFKVIGETGNGEEAIQLAKQYRPHIVIMDINMPGMNGIEATQQLVKILPDTGIIGVSLHTQPAYARKMMQKGARGYITKNSPHEEMCKAILEVYQGGKYVCQEIKDNLSEQVMIAETQPVGLQVLTPREMEIVKLIKIKSSTQAIAEQLGITLKTVEVHRHHIIKKLHLKNVAALVAFINTHSHQLTN